MFRFLIYGLLIPTAIGVEETTELNGLNFPFPDNPHLQPFNISVNPKFIVETVQRARSFRPSIGLHEYPEWADGPPAKDINALAQYWATDYDWSSTQEQINSNFTHFVTTISGPERYPHPVPLHFIHEPSPDNDNAIPLLLLHGWPSTNLEWSKVIHPLAHPSNPDEPSFHVVAPDLPGFGFSPAPQFPGLGPREIGDAADALMEQLGYTSYGICSTDLGWWVARQMTYYHGDHIIGHIADEWVVAPNVTDQARFAAGETTPAETKYMKALNAFVNMNSGYSGIQETRPLSLAYALTDSPVGFAAWVWQVFEMISDGYEYSLNELITSTMLLYIQGTYGHIRLYKEIQKNQAHAFPITNVSTGITQWGNLNNRYPGMRYWAFTPRSWVERTAPNLTYFKRHRSGGHFPALTRPQAWVQDVGTFFAQLAES